MDGFIHVHQKYINIFGQICFFCGKSVYVCMCASCVYGKYYIQSDSQIMLKTTGLEFGIGEGLLQTTYLVTMEASVL